jgi:hypothetical protein
VYNEFYRPDTIPLYCLLLLPPPLLLHQAQAALDDGHGLVALLLADDQRGDESDSIGSGRQHQHTSVSGELDKLSRGGVVLEGDTSHETTASEVFGDQLGEEFGQSDDQAVEVRGRVSEGGEERLVVESGEHVDAKSGSEGLTAESGSVRSDRNELGDLVSGHDSADRETVGEGLGHGDDVWLGIDGVVGMSPHCAGSEQPALRGVSRPLV